MLNIVKYLLQDSRRTRRMFCTCVNVFYSFKDVILIWFNTTSVFLASRRSKLWSTFWSPFNSYLGVLWETCPRLDIRVSVTLGYCIFSKHFPYFFRGRNHMKTTSKQNTLYHCLVLLYFGTYLPFFWVYVLMVKFCWHLYLISKKKMKSICGVKFCKLLGLATVVATYDPHRNEFLFLNDRHKVIHIMVVNYTLKSCVVSCFFRAHYPS